MIVSLQSEFRSDTGHSEDLVGPFTDKCGHWPKKFVSDEPFELILSYEIVVTSPVTIAEFSVCHKDGFTDIILCRDGIYKIGMYYAECARTHKEVRKGYPYPQVDAIVGDNQP